MAELQLAYMRRVRWEARIHAVEMGKVLAELLGGRKTRGRAGLEPRGPGKEVARPDRVGADGLLAKMGVNMGRLKGKPKAARVAGGPPNGGTTNEDGSTR